MQLLLIAFDALLGPKVKFSMSDPPSEKITEAQEKILERLMDISDSSFFIHSQPGENGFESANFIFEIESPRARGKVEMLQLALIPPYNIKPRIFQRELEDCALEFNKDKDIWKGLYHESEKPEKDSLKYFDRINDLLKKCLENCSKNPQLQQSGRLVFYGLQKVGKSSIIKRLVDDSYDPNIKPTLGMQVIKSVINSFAFQVHDMGGQVKIRETWYQKPLRPNAIVFVLDSSEDKKAQEESRYEFNRMVDHYFIQNKEKINSKTPVLILGNKIDLAKKMTEKDIENLLDLKKYSLNYKVGTVSALKNVGIEENFKWLVTVLVQSCFDLN